MKRYIVATNKNAWSVKQENSLFTVFFSPCGTEKRMCHDNEATTRLVAMGNNNQRLYREIPLNIIK